MGVLSLSTAGVVAEGHLGASELRRVLSVCQMLTAGLKEGGEA